MTLLPAHAAEAVSVQSACLIKDLTLNIAKKANVYKHCEERHIGGDA